MNKTAGGVEDGLGTAGGARQNPLAVAESIRLLVT